MRPSDKFRLALIGGPLIAALVGLVLASNGADYLRICTAVIATWTIIWWIFEPVPIPVTSLIPLATMPLLGVLPASKVGESYGHPLILLLLGGFILSTAMEQSGAHRRVALGMVRLVGGASSRRLVFGFMAASAVLSMWISNTATTLMLLPVAMAVLDKAEDQRLATPLLLGIAYAASVGGIGTPIGTPPNLVFMSNYEEATGQTVSFVRWMTWGIPVVVLLVPLIGLWLTRKLHDTGRFELPEVGHWAPHETRVMVVFALTALAWITRQEPFGGWSGALGLSGANDASVALLAVVLMFIVPNGKGGRLLDWQDAARLPWGVLILFGAGLTIAAAFQASGLSQDIGRVLSGMSAWPLIVVIAIVCLTITFLTEMTSNTATTTLLMPILAAAAIGAGLEPKLLMIPAAMSASCAFMLPVATAPNTIMFSTGKFSVATMAREGFALNLIGACLITAVCYLLL